jgi:hypothetical protein
MLLNILFGTLLLAIFPYGEGSSLYTCAIIVGMAKLNTVGSLKTAFTSA